MDPDLFPPDDIAATPVAPYEAFRPDAVDTNHDSHAWLLCFGILSHATLTSIAFGFFLSDFGKCTFRTPSLYLAFQLRAMASSGSVKFRMKLP